MTTHNNGRRRNTKPPTTEAVNYSIGQLVKLARVLVTVDYQDSVGAKERDHIATVYLRRAMDEVQGG